MDFNDVFSTTDILGMAIRQEMKKDLIKALEGHPNNYKLALLNTQKEVIEEIIAELKMQEG